MQTLLSIFFSDKHKSIQINFSLEKMHKEKLYMKKHSLNKKLKEKKNRKLGYRMSTASSTATNIK